MYKVNAVVLPVVALLLTLSQFAAGRAPSLRVPPEEASRALSPETPIPCFPYVYCDLKRGCDPMQLLPFEQFLPAGYIIGCSSSLVDEAGNVYYLDFMDSGEMVFEKSVGPVTAGNFNPHRIERPIYVRLDDPSTRIVFLQINLAPWPEDRCQPEDDPYSTNCHKPDPLLNFVPVIVADYSQR